MGSGSAIRFFYAARLVHSLLKYFFLLDFVNFFNSFMIFKKSGLNIDNWSNELIKGKKANEIEFFKKYNNT